eukprot:COSAG06_NODE_5749_length_3293_cov_23.132749_4_plen_73_part_00
MPLFCGGLYNLYLCGGWQDNGRQQAMILEYRYRCVVIFKICVVQVKAGEFSAREMAASYLYRGGTRAQHNHT